MIFIRDRYRVRFRFEKGQKLIERKGFEAYELGYLSDPVVNYLLFDNSVADKNFTLFI